MKHRVWPAPGRLNRAPLTAAVLLALSACAPPPAAVDLPPFEPVLDMHDLMNAVLDPATDVIWGAAGTIITADGSEELTPTTPEGWQAVRNAAAVITESGNLLLLPGRAEDAGDWREYSLALIALGKEAMAAAEAEDGDAVFEVGGKLYNLCVACHQAYDLED